MIQGPINVNESEDLERIESSEDTAHLISNEEEIDKTTCCCHKCCFNVCDPRGFLHRFVALFFMCFLSFGSYFCYDNPAALEDDFKNDLNLTTTEYTVLYSVYSWPNVVLCFIGGYLIDRVFGIRLGTNIYVSITFLGQIVCALGAIFNLYWLIVIGRFVFGIGGESLAVGQNNYAVLWFKGKELNMVFGLQLSFARIGSAINFIVMDPIYKWVHTKYSGAECLGIALFIASLTCLISLICSLVMGFLDSRAERILRRNENSRPEVVRLRDVTGFGLTFWLISLICVLYYVAIFPFIGLGKKFFMERFHLSSLEANRINSLVYLISAFASPAFGFFIDLTGKNVMWISIAVAGTIGSHSMMAFTMITPYVGMAIMGVAYSVLAASLWPLVSLIIPEHQLGTAYGVCQAIQNLGLAVVMIITGLIKDHFGYRWLEIFFIISLLCAFLATALLWVADRYKDGVLNMTPGDRKTSQEKLHVKERTECEQLLSTETGSSNQQEYMRLPPNMESDESQHFR